MVELALAVLRALAAAARSVAVVVSRELFDRLSGNPDSLVDFMQQSPLCGQDDLQLDRDASLPREVAF